MLTYVYAVSPFGIVRVTPDDVIATSGDNIIFQAETNAGPNNEYSWQFSCVDGLSNCNKNRTVNTMATGKHK